MASNNLSFNRLRGRENYSEWKVGAKAYLTSKGFWSEVEIKLAADATADARLKNQKTLAELTLLIEPSLYSYIEDVQEPKDAWEALKTIFEDKGAVRKVTLLKNWISLRASECSGIHDYVNKSVTLHGKIKTAGFKIDDEVAACILLCGLGDDYKALIMSLEVKEQLSLDYVKNVLLQSIDFDDDIKESAMQVKKFNKGNKKKAVKCYECGGPHYKNKCPNRGDKKKEKSDVVLYSALATKDDNGDGDWFVDSGATKHMTNIDRGLTNKKKPTIKQVKAANGETIEIKNVGDLKCNIDGESNFTLRDVQFIPKLCVNLLSVSQMVMNGHTVIFDKNGCRILSEDKILLAKGKLIDGMFKMNIKTSESVFTVKHNKTDEDSILWHRRLAHVSFNTLKTVMNIPVKTDLKCVVCTKGKHARSPFSEIGTRAKKLLDVIHTDVCGPFPVKSLGGAKFFVSFIDDYSRKVYVYPLKSKAEVFSKFVIYKKLVENQLDSTIKIVRSDNGTEYVNKNFEELFAKSGIKHEKSTPYSPQQNGLSERMNRTILEKTRCMLLDSQLAKHFWAEAVQAAVDVINTLPNSPNGVAPDEIWYNKKCNLKHFRVFGSRAMVWKPEMKRGKLDSKSFECVYLRKADDAKAFRLYDMNTRKIVISHDVVFMEDGTRVIDPNCVTKSSQVFLENDDCFDGMSEIEVVPVTAETDASAPVAAGENVGNVSTDANETLTIDQHSVSSSSDTTFDENPATSSSEATFESAIDDVDDTMNETGIDAGALDDTTQDPSFRTRAKMNENAERPQTRGLVRDLMNLHCAFSIFSEPENYGKAMNDENAAKWKIAMREEFDSLIKNDTWQLVPRPPNVKTVDNRWVYKIKPEHGSTPIRFKARLVARGFTQQYGVNYLETFSPVVRFTSIRIILAIAAQRKMDIKQFDVKTAFLNGELSETIFMEQPIGFQDGTNRVCRLKKSLYGLKQASRCWNKKFCSFIELFGFVKSVYDPCVFISRKNDALTILAIHVDDGIVVGERTSDIESVLKYLNEQFEIKEMDVGCFLGLEIEQFEDKSIFIHQSSYAERVLKRFDMLDCNGVLCPSDHNQVMTTFDGSDMSTYPYRELIGSLMYLAVGTRPDIAHAVSIASRYLERPTVVHERAAKRILKYIKKTFNFGISYFNSNPDEMIAYSDADYAGDVDTRKSTSGFVFTLGRSVISWGSEKQKSVSLSTTESEYMAASQAVKELVWLKNIFCEILNYDLKIILYMDNQSAIRLIKNPEFHKRSKHIDIRYHFIREKFNENLFELKYINTNDMLADMFTKALPAPKFIDFVEKLGIKQK